MYDNSLALSEYVALPQGFLEKGVVTLVGNSASFEEATQVGPLLNYLNTLPAVEFKPGENVVVVGAGPMRLLHILIRKVGNRAVLDQTAFNPRGEGLVGDTGSLNAVRVVDSVKADGDSIAHVLEQIPRWSAGSSVHGMIDWDRRYRIMRMHTSACLARSSTKKLALLSQGIRLNQTSLDFSLDDS